MVLRGLNRDVAGLLMLLTVNKRSVREQLTTADLTREDVTWVKIRVMVSVLRSQPMPSVNLGSKPGYAHTIMQVR